ncbi:MAG: hypothetical protein IJ092_07585 [Atopobiaceae bacterium]|nr:hypothetical protein [Atopobiaceae bacterium]
MSGGRSGLRKANAMLSALMLALFLVHGVVDSFLMVGVGTPLSKVVSWVLVGICVVHAAIGVVLTLDTLKAQQQAGAAYPIRNKRFWAVRITGLLIAVLIALHVVIFARFDDGPVRLSFFGSPQLVVSVLLVAAIAVHVLVSAEPLLISLGIAAPGERALDVILVLAGLLLLMVAAFVVYYLRWSML